MLKTKYKSRLLHALKPKTQQHSVDVKVKNQTDTKFKFLNNIISQRPQQKATKRTSQNQEQQQKSKRIMHCYRAVQLKDKNVAILILKAR